MMNLTDKTTIKNLLRENNVRIRYELGQNFLINKNILEHIIIEGEISDTDEIIEIGPGLGVLTKELCKRAGHVIAYEKDGNMVHILKKSLGEGYKKVEIIEGDFLDTPLKNKGEFKVIANLPYQITTPVIRRFLEGDNLPERIVILVQKEMAQRLVAKPGKRERGWVSVLVQLLGDAYIACLVYKEDFFPIPDVDGAVLVVKNIKKISELNRILRVVKAGFSSKRRKLANALAGGLRVDQEIGRELVREAGIDENARAEDLDNTQWKKLTEVVNNLS